MQLLHQGAHCDRRVRAAGLGSLRSRNLNLRWIEWACRMAILLWWDNEIRFFWGCWYPGTAGSPCSVWPPCVPFQNWDDLIAPWKHQWFVGSKIPKSSTICGGGFRSRKLVFVFTNEVEAQRFLLCSLDGGGVRWGMKPSKSGHRMGCYILIYIDMYLYMMGEVINLRFILREWGIPPVMVF